MTHTQPLASTNAAVIRGMLEAGTGLETACKRSGWTNSRDRKDNGIGVRRPLFGPMAERAGFNCASALACRVRTVHAISMMRRSARMGRGSQAHSCRAERVTTSGRVRLSRGAGQTLTCHAARRRFLCDTRATTMCAIRRGWSNGGSQGVSMTGSRGFDSHDPVPSVPPAWRILWPGCAST